MILNFKDYNDYLKDDNDYLFEAMSISTEVRDETEKIIDFIQSGVNNGSMDVKTSKDYDGMIHTSMTFKKKPEFDIFGCNCSFDIKINNFTGKIDDDIYDTKGDMLIHTMVEYVDGVSKISFVIGGHIFLVNGKVTDESRGMISHELRHAYVSSKIYGGVSKTAIDERIKSSKKWKEIYANTVTYIQYYKRNYPSIRFLEGIDFYNIMFTIYQSDVSEIAAFTQQAYEYCSKCKTIGDVKSKMKKTNLYNMMESFRNVMIIICDDETAKEYDNKKKTHMMDNLPSIKELKKLFEKRYRKICSNYGKVIAFIHSELEGDKGELIDVRL